MLFETFLESLYIRLSILIQETKCRLAKAHKNRVNSTSLGIFYVSLFSNRSHVSKLFYSRAGEGAILFIPFLQQAVRTYRYEVTCRIFGIRVDKCAVAINNGKR